jgi:flagellar basal body-associated protein FliL
VGNLFKNKKVLIILLVVFLGGGYAAKTFLLKPAPLDEKKLAKEEGAIFTIPEEFLVNLAPSSDNVSHYVRATVSLGVSKLSAGSVPPPAEGTSAAIPIEGQAEIQDIIGDVFRGQSRDALLTQKGRDKTKETIITLVNKNTELKIVKVYFPKFAVL